MVFIKKQFLAPFASLREKYLFFVPFVGFVVND